MRSWWRHEQVSIAAGVVRRPTGTEDSGNKEEVESEKHVAPLAQNTPPLGARPGILAEPGPHRSDRSRRHSSGDTHPTFGLPVPAGRRVGWWTPPRSASSQPLRWKPRGSWRRRRRWTKKEKKAKAQLTKEEMDLVVERRDPGTV